MILLTKFKTEKYSTKITQVACQKETSAYVYVAVGGYCHTGFCRQARRSGYDNYHNTWEEARDFLLERARQRVRVIKEELHKAQSELGQIESLTPPDSTCEGGR